MKMGFNYKDILNMTEIEAEEYLMAYADIVNPKPKQKEYKVRRPNRKS